MTSFKSLLGLLATICLVLLSASSCQSGKNPPTDNHADSLIEATTDILFMNPLRADSLYARIQQQTSDSAAWWRAQLFRGTAHFQAADTAEASRIYKQVENWCLAHPGHETLEGQMWNHRGVAAYICGNVNEAVECYERSYDRLCQGKEKSKSVISTAINLADLYQQRGDTPKAAYYYRNALFLCDSLNSNESRAGIYCGLALVYTDLNDFHQAHHFFAMARPLMPNEPMMSQFYYHSSLGNCHYFEHRYDEALKDFEKARQLAVQFHNKIGEFKCESNMLEVELMRGNLPAATERLKRAEALAAATPDIDKASLFYLRSLKTDWAIAKGDIPITKGIEASENDTSGIKSLRYLMLHYRRLKHYAALHHNWESAYRLQAEAARYADSLRGLQSTNYVEEMKLRFQRDTTLLHQRLALADYETRTARQSTFILAVIIAAIGLLLAAAIAVWFYRRHTRHRIQQQFDRITELRMDIVRNRVSPHYIFNVLNTVLPRLSHHPDINVPIGLLIDVLRGNLLTSGKVAVSLHDEIRLVQRFLELHQLTKGPWPRVEWQIGEGLFESQLLVPAMVAPDSSGECAQARLPHSIKRQPHPHRGDQGSNTQRRNAPSESHRQWLRLQPRTGETHRARHRYRTATALPHHRHPQPPQLARGNVQHHQPAGTRPWHHHASRPARQLRLQRDDQMTLTWDGRMPHPSIPERFFFPTRRRTVFRCYALCHGTSCYKSSVPSWQTKTRPSPNTPVKKA